MSRFAALLEAEALGQALSEVPSLPTAPTTWPNGYQWRQDHRISAGVVAADVAEAVLYLPLAVGGRIEEGDAADIRVEVGGSPVPYHLLRHDTILDIAHLQILLPLVSSSADTIISVYAGKAGASSEGDIAAVYAGMLQALDGATGVDLSGAGRSAAPSAVSAGVLADGRPAGVYNGASIMSSAAVADWISGRAGLAVVADIEADGALDGQDAVLWAQSSDTGGKNFGADTAKLTRLGASGSGVPNVWNNTLATTSGLTTYTLTDANAAAAGPAVVAGIWSQAIAPKIYVDAVEQEVSVAVARAGPIQKLSDGWHVGTGFQGKIAQILIAKTALSPAWLDLNVRTKRAPLSLWGAGAWHGVGDPTPILAMPVSAAVDAGDFVDVDVAAAAIGSGTLQSVTQGARGAVTVEGGVARYTPSGGEAGADAFTFGLSDGTFAGVGRCDVTISAGIPAPSGDMPIPLRVKVVNNQAQLDAAVADLRAGDKVQMGNGTYNMPGSINTDGTATDPIVFAALNKQQVILNGNIVINGDHVWLHGCKTNSRIELKGFQDRILRFEFTTKSSGDWVVISTGRECLVSYCDWPVIGGGRFAIDMQPRNGARDNTVSFSRFRRWTGTVVPCRSGGTIADTNNIIGGSRFETLLFDADNALASNGPEFCCEQKGSGGRMFRITVKNVNSGFKGCPGVRHGLGNKLEEIVCKSGRGIFIFHGREASPNELHNSRVEGGGIIRIMAGTYNGENLLANDGADNYPNANHCLVSYCNGPAFNGWMYSSRTPTFRAIQTRFRNHTGTITPEFQTGQTTSGANPYPAPGAIVEVVEGMVGPNAGTAWEY